MGSVRTCSTRAVEDLLRNEFPLCTSSFEKFILLNLDSSLFLEPSSMYSFSVGRIISTFIVYMIDPAIWVLQGWEY